MIRNETRMKIVESNNNFLSCLMFHNIYTIIYYIYTYLHVTFVLLLSLSLSLILHNNYIFLCLFIFVRACAEYVAPAFRLLMSFLYISMYSFNLILSRSKHKETEKHEKKQQKIWPKSLETTNINKCTECPGGDTHTTTKLKKKGQLNDNCFLSRGLRAVRNNRPNWMKERVSAERDIESAGGGEWDREERTKR